MVDAERKLAAIMFTDIVGYTALTQSNESLALRLLEKHRELIRPIFSKHRGREVKAIGDSFLVEFDSALDSTNCAVEIQRVLHDYNLSSKEEWRIRLRIGIHLGDVIRAGGDVLGDAVNIASRIEPLAAAEGVCLSEQVYDQVRNKVPFRLIKLERRELKNVAFPIDVYKLELPWEEDDMKPGTENDKHRLAVLPLANISPNASDEYFADGLTEELITTLSQLRGLQVIARTSVMTYKGASKRVSEIGRELEVGSVLEGSVRKVANKIRVTTQLIETATQARIWSSTYDKELDDVFAIQSDIAKRVAEALQVELLAGEEKRIEREPTHDLDAYALYLRGRQLMYDRTERSLNEAQKQFELAFLKDPKFAAAYAGFADCMYLMAQNGNQPGKKKMYDASKAMVAKALELDENLAEAHSTLGGILMAQHEYMRAELEFKIAVSLNPSYAQAHHWYALCLAMLGRFDEAFAEMDLARKTDPFSPVIATATGFLYWSAGRDEEALKQWIAVRERTPGFVVVHLWLGLYFLDKGRTDEAFENLTNPVLAAQMNEVVYKSNLAYA